MKAFVLACALSAAPSFLSAETYVTPVATARVNGRLYSTTTAIRNDGAAAVSCEAIYAVPNARNGGTLRAKYQIGAGETLVEHDTLMEAGAFGTMRFVCSGPAFIVARVLTSADGGKTFDNGRIFPAASEANAIPRTASVETTTDLLVMEVKGTTTPFEIAVRDHLGTTVGARKYDLRPFSQQLINLSRILPGSPTVTVEIRSGTDAGRLVISRPTNDPKLVALTERPGSATAGAAESRIATGAVAATVASTPPAIQQIVAASFKAAPLRDPATGLVYLRDRWYDPATGSFVTPDPEGHRDSSNLYSYCGGDPVNCSDPTGRAAALSRSGWILATDNRNGNRIRRFSPEEIAKDPLGVRRFIGLRSNISAVTADDIMIRAGYGAWFGNRAGIRAAAVGAEIAKPTVEATATGLSLLSGVTVVGGVAQATQALVDSGPTKTNLAMAGLTVVGLGATDDIVRLGNFADDAAEIFGIVPYRPSLPGVEQHHGVLDVWAAANVPGYVSRGQAPQP
ncbi:MAG TPA: RHS repeat-associated core domain-containing protein [Thermoanaerobaculia bacterium]|jgi:RHS repeat-associated protein